MAKFATAPYTPEETTWGKIKNRRTRRWRGGGSCSTSVNHQACDAPRIPRHAPRDFERRIVPHTEGQLPNAQWSASVSVLARGALLLERGDSAASAAQDKVAGATIEHGKLGISTFGYRPLEDYDPGRRAGFDDICGLDIAQPEDIEWILELTRQNPDYRHKGISLL